MKSYNPSNRVESGAGSQKQRESNQRSLCCSKSGEGLKSGAVQCSVSCGGMQSAIISVVRCLCEGQTKEVQSPTTVTVWIDVRQGAYREVLIIITKVDNRLS